MSKELIEKCNVLARRVEKLESELKHWKSNHAAEVQRARVLKERADMPLERVQAYEQIGQLLAERDALAAELKALRDQKPVAAYKGHRHIPSDTKEFWGMADNHLPAGTHLYARPVLSRELTDKVIERLFDESAFQENEMRDAADYFAHEIERYLKGEGE
jgi:cell division protein FtsB